MTNIKRYELTNVADGWPCHVVRVDMVREGKTVRTWSTDGRELEPSADGNSLSLPGTKTQFVLPDDDDE